MPDKEKAKYSDTYKKATILEMPEIFESL